MGLHGKNLIINNMKLILLFLLFPFAAMSQDTLQIDGKYTQKTGVNYTFTIPEIPVLQNQVNNVTERVKALENVTGKQVQTSTYTITKEDNRTLIVITGTCTITVPNVLPVGFTCTIKRIGGDVRFTGNFLSYAGWKRSARQYENVYVESDGVNNYLSGNLKL